MPYFVNNNHILIKSPSKQAIAHFGQIFTWDTPPGACAETIKLIAKRMSCPPTNHPPPTTQKPPTHQPPPTIPSTGWDSVVWLLPFFFLSLPLVFGPAGWLGFQIRFRGRTPKEAVLWLGAWQGVEFVRTAWPLSVARFLARKADLSRNLD